MNQKVQIHLHFLSGKCIKNRNSINLEDFVEPEVNQEFQIEAHGKKYTVEVSKPCYIQFSHIENNTKFYKVIIHAKNQNPDGYWPNIPRKI